MGLQTDSLPELIDHYERVRATPWQWAQYRLMIDGRPATIIIASDDAVRVVDAMVKHFEQAGMVVNDPRSTPRPTDGG